MSVTHMASVCASLLGACMRVCRDLSAENVLVGLVPDPSAPPPPTPSPPAPLPTPDSPKAAHDDPNATPTPQPFAPATEESLAGWMLGCDAEGRPLVRLTGLGMCERLGQRMAFALAPSFKRAAGRSEPE